MIAFVLGLWLAGMVMVAYVASLSLRTVGSVMAIPPHEASKWIDVLGKDKVRTLLLHGSSEVNRGLFEFWGNADLIICVFLLVAMVMNKSGKVMIILTAVLLLLGTASTYLLTPQMVAVGRQLDFRVVFPVPPEIVQFAALERMYFGVSLVRVLLVGTMVAMLLNRSSRSPRLRRSRLDEVDSVNYTDDSRINR